MQVGGASESGEAIGIASPISEVNRILGELDLIITAQCCIWRGVDPIEIGVVEFHARGAVLDIYCVRSHSQ